MKMTLAAIAFLLSVGARAQSWPLQGQHSGIRHTLIAVIKDEKAWEELWRKHDDSKALPDVDFKSEIVVAVFIGEKRTPGTRVELVVQNDPTDRSRLIVYYRQVHTQKLVSTEVLCQPYAIIKLPLVRGVDVEPDPKISYPEAEPPIERHIDTRKIHALPSDSNPDFD